jgi:hypothetical protein
LERLWTPVFLHQVAIPDDTKPTEPLNFRDFVVQMPEGTAPDVALEASTRVHQVTPRNGEISWDLMILMAGWWFSMG